MSLVLQKQIDFSSILIKGLNSLKHDKLIEFDYYTISRFNLGGNEIAVVDDTLQMIKALRSAFDEKINILLISDITQEKSEYYFYIKDQKFSDTLFDTVIEMKPVYNHFLKLEEKWKKYGAELSTFDVSESDDCCLLLSFDSKARTM